jgi:hypothetical protein
MAQYNEPTIDFVYEGQQSFSDIIPTSTDDRVKFSLLKARKYRAFQNGDNSGKSIFINS